MPDQKTLVLEKNAAIIILSFLEEYQKRNKMPSKVDGTTYPIVDGKHLRFSKKASGFAMSHMLKASQIFGPDKEKRSLGHFSLRIIAYYGDGMVKDDGGILGQLKAVLFRIGKSELNGNQVPLEMHKSVVAVPVDGCLMIKAFLMDVKTNKVIWDDMIEYRAKPGNADNWSIKCKGYSFNLKVAWSEFTSA
ncbi:hypothetical protein Tco_0156316 [Tanacetum coccineum]